MKFSGFSLEEYIEEKDKLNSEVSAIPQPSTALSRRKSMQPKSASLTVSGAQFKCFKPPQLPVCLSTNERWDDITTMLAELESGEVPAEDQNLDS